MNNEKQAVLHFNVAVFLSILFPTVCAYSCFGLPFEFNKQKSREAHYGPAPKTALNLVEYTTCSHGSMSCC